MTDATAVVLNQEPKLKNVSLVEEQEESSRSEELSLELLISMLLVLIVMEKESNQKNHATFAVEREGLKKRKK